MGYATLGFPGGPGLTFRIDPQDINWGFKINTSVSQTVGGRVVQVNGATLSDITVNGLFGEDVSQAKGKPIEDGEHPGRSWRLAKRFSHQIRSMMEWQARDAKSHTKMHQAAIFTYPPRGWKFRCYIRGFADPDGGTVTIGTGKFSHGYTLTLFVVQEGSTALVQAGAANGVLNQERAKAIDDYIARISEGIGWKPSMYNGDFLDYYSRGTAFSAAENNPKARKEAANPTAPPPPGKQPPDAGP